MDIFEGTMIYGNYDDENDFTVKRIKNIFTETSLNEVQIQNLYNYLSNHVNDEDGQIVSFYDQLLLKLSPEEVKVLLADLEGVMERYQ